FVPGAGRPGARAGGPDRRIARDGRRPPPRAGGVRRGRRGAVRVLHAGAGGRRRRPAGPRPVAGRTHRPGGPVREPVPVHGLREDPRRRPAGGGALRGGARVSVRVGERVRGGVGESVRRIDGVPKVTGAFAYASDLWAERLLWGHTVRSPHPHARIRGIQIGEAVASPG